MPALFSFHCISLNESCKFFLKKTKDCLFRFLAHSFASLRSVSYLLKNRTRNIRKCSETFANRNATKKRRAFNGIALACPALFVSAVSLFARAKESVVESRRKEKKRKRRGKSEKFPRRGGGEK